MVELKIFKVLSKNLKSIESIPNALYLTEDGGLYMTDIPGNLVQFGCSRKEYEEMSDFIESLKAKILD